MSLVQLGDDLNPRFIELFDTGGIGMVDRDDLSEDVERQIDTAMNEADVILFVVDIRDELMPLDEEVAQPAPLLEDAGHPGDEQGGRPRVRPVVAPSSTSWAGASRSPSPRTRTATRSNCCI